MTISTNFPGALDTTSNLLHNVVDSTPTATTHAQQHNNVADALIAVETALGVNPRGSYADMVHWLADAIVKTPSAIQRVTPSADVIALVVKQGNSGYASDLFQAQSSGGSALVFIDSTGIFSAQGLKIAGTALASTHLSDSASLARTTTPNTFANAQTVSANGGKTTFALTNTGSNIGFTIGTDTTLYRALAGVLQTDGMLRVVGNLRAGGATAPNYAVDATGDVNASGMYRVGGTQIAAANLLNGVVGSGAVVLANNPLLTGPRWANQAASGATTLVNGSASLVLVNTTAAAFTLTLPAAPSTGSWFLFCDVTGTWATHHLTVAPNGKTIDGSSSSLVLSTANGCWGIVYDGTGWHSTTTPALPSIPQNSFAFTANDTLSPAPDCNLGSWQIWTCNNESVSSRVLTIPPPINPPSGTMELGIAIKTYQGTPDSAPFTIAWNTIYKSAGFTLPGSSVAVGNTLYARFQWDGLVWVCIGISTGGYFGGNG